MRSPDRALPPVPHQRSAARSSGGERVDRVQRQRDRFAVRALFGALQLPDRPGDVPVAGGAFLARFGEASRREPADRVQHAVDDAAVVAARALHLHQRLVHQHGERVQRVRRRPDTPPWTDRPARRRPTASAAAGPRRRAACGRTRSRTACMVACRGPSPGCAALPASRACSGSPEFSSACSRLSSSRADSTRSRAAASSSASGRPSSRAAIRVRCGSSAGADRLPAAGRHRALGQQGHRVAQSAADGCDS